MIPPNRVVRRCGSAARHARRRRYCFGFGFGGPTRRMNPVVKNIPATNGSELSLSPQVIASTAAQKRTKTITTQGLFSAPKLWRTFARACSFVGNFN